MNLRAQLGTIDDRTLMRLAILLAGLLIASIVALSVYIYIDSIRPRDTLLERELRQVEEQVRREPGNLELRVIAANLYLERKQFDRAIAQSREALKVNGQNVDALMILGSAYQQKGDLALAASFLEQVIELNEDNEMAHLSRKLALVHYQLGEIYLRSGNSAGSVSVLKRALEIEPTDADVHLLLGQAYLAEGQLDQAVQTLRAALRFVPNYEDIYRTLSDVWQRQGDQDKAAFAQSMLSYAEDDLAEAERGLTHAVQSLPDMVEPRVGLGMVYEKLGKQDEAIEAYRQVLALDGNSYIAKQALGRLGVK